MNNFILKLKTKLNGIKTVTKINPHRHWNDLLYLSFIIVSILSIISFYILFGIKNDSLFQIQVNPKAAGTILNEDLLKSTINLYDLKAQKEENIMNSKSDYVDPGQY